jgi:hypothetical protein
MSLKCPQADNVFGCGYTMGKDTFLNVFHRCSNAMPTIDPEDNVNQEDKTRISKIAL